jgi:hypothetical protein
MAGGLYTCNRKCGKSFDSLNLKNAHMTICQGRMYVVSNGTEQERFRDLPMQVLPSAHQAPEEDSETPYPVYPEAS